MTNYGQIDVQLYRKLLESYRRCIRNKPSAKQSSFHLHHESNLHALTRALSERTYKPWKSNIFIVTNPKPREVIAAHMRDRVVHHLLYDYMNPYWERRFFKNSYACLKGKGPLRAVRDLQAFLAINRRKGGPSLHYLKVDIQSFFASIDLDVLHRIVRPKMSNDFYGWLFDVILRHRATDKGNYQLKSSESMWELLPKYKSLFHAPPNRGLPIGNLTSQFFANVYLNELDQFIAHTLKREGIVFWQRYVDDVVLLSPDRHLLRHCISQIQDFLVTHLNISLNYRKTILQPVSNGIDHLGYFIKPTHTLVRQRVVGSYRKKMATLCAEEAPDAKAVLASANSYFGYFRRADSHRLRQGAAAELLAKRDRLPLIDVSKTFDKVVLLEDTAALEATKAAAADRKQAFVHEMSQIVPNKKELGRYVRRWRDIEDVINPTTRV